MSETESLPSSNTRQYGIDYAKVFLIIGMVLVHLTEWISIPEMPARLYSFINDLWGGILNAPLFMFCMGVGFTYSKRGVRFKQGVKLFVAAWILNLIRLTIPKIIYFASIGAPEESMAAIIKELFSLEIYHFAGLSIMVWALLKRVKVKDWMIVLFSVILSVIGSFVRFMDFGSFVPNEILGLFIGTKGKMINCCFPFFNLFIFVAFGYCFGQVLHRVKNVRKFYLYTGVCSTVIAVPVLIHLLTRCPEFLGPAEIDFYQMTTVEAFVCIISGIALICIFETISWILPQRINKAISTVSMSLSPIYFVHWILLGWITVFILNTILGIYSVSVAAYLLLAAVILALSIFIGIRWKRLKTWLR